MKTKSHPNAKPKIDRSVTILDKNESQEDEVISSPVAESEQTNVQVSAEMEAENEERARELIAERFGEQAVPDTQ